MVCPFLVERNSQENKISLLFYIYKAFQNSYNGTSFQVIVSKLGLLKNLSNVRCRVSLRTKVFRKLRINSGRQFLMVNLVFAVTGTLSVLCSGHLLLYFGIDSATMGNFFYWLSRIFILFLCYQCLLIVVAVPFGQFGYFWYLQKKMLKRVGFNLD